MKEIAKDLLSIKAVTLSPTEPYTWASGLKSPIYCDNRLTMSYPAVRKNIAKGLAKLIKENYPTVEVIAGTATAGIPHAAWVAEELDLPMVYIRGASKGHGKKNQIEGHITSGQKMVIIEDLISTGGSVIDAAIAAKNEGADVLGVAAIFTYQLAKGITNAKENNLEVLTLTNYDELIEVALENDYIEQDSLALLAKWRENPENWLA